MISRLLKLAASQSAGLFALFLVLSGGTAYALSGHNTVFSDDITNGQVRSVDIRDNDVSTVDVADESLTGNDVAPDSLGGGDINESQLGTVPNSSALGGRGPGSFASSSVYKKESPIQAGTNHGDGTFIISFGCDAGDILLSGGPANVSGTSDIVESFPTPGSTNSWTARINTHGVADSFSVVLLCLDQA